MVTQVTGCCDPLQVPCCQYRLDNRQDAYCVCDVTASVTDALFQGKSFPSPAHRLLMGRRREKQHGEQRKKNLSISDANSDAAALLFRVFFRAKNKLLPKVRKTEPPVRRKRRKQKNKNKRKTQSFVGWTFVLSFLLTE